MSDVSPWAVDWKRVMPRKPVNAKPADFPRLSCSVPPSRKIMVNGKTTAATSLPGSRENFSTSRPAMAAIAFSSNIFSRQQPEVGVLERRRFGPQHGERLVDRVHHLVRGSDIKVNHEVALLRERHIQGMQPAAKSAAVGRIDVQRLVDQ